MFKMQRIVKLRLPTHRFLWIGCVVLMLGSLTTKGIARGAGPSVQKILDDAVKRGAKQVTLPQGRINVEGKLRLRGANGLAIEGASTTLVFSDRDGTAWSFDSCQNIVLRGFTIDYDPLPFVQGRITGRAADGRRYDFTVCDGYPGLREEDSAHYRQGYIFQSNARQWKPWVPDLYASQVEIVDARHGTVHHGLRAHPP